MKSPESTLLVPPLMTVPAFAALVGLEATVVQAQASRGYWPTVRVGKRLLINVEAVRVASARRAEGFSL